MRIVGSISFLKQVKWKELMDFVLFFHFYITIVLELELELERGRKWYEKVQISFIIFIAIIFWVFEKKIWKTKSNIPNFIYWVSLFFSILFYSYNNFW